MKIAQLMLAKQFGGAERSFVDLTVQLNDMGHEVLAIGERYSESLDRIEAVDLPTARVSCLGTWDIFTIKAIKKVLQKFVPDVLHCHLARGSYLGGKAGRQLGIPVISKTHNLVDPKYYKNIDRIVVTTLAQKTHLKNHGVNTRRIALIPNFSSIKSRCRGSRTYSDTGTYTIKSLGRFVRKKGFDTLIEAISLVKKRTGWDIKLVLGGDGPEAKSLRRLTEKLDACDSVEFCGWIDDVPGFLEDADLFVLPSREEPFGIVLLEAMAMSVPILSTQTQGPIEILDEFSGFFTEADDPDKMAIDIVTLFLSDVRYAKAEAALKNFEKFYTVENICEKYCFIYRELINQQVF